MTIRQSIKVPLVFLENILFTLVPFSREPFERYIFNPYRVITDPVEYMRQAFVKFSKDTSSFFTLEKKTILELGPGGSLGFGIFCLNAGAQKYIALDAGEHFFASQQHMNLYQKASHPTLQEIIFKKDKDGKLDFNNEHVEYLSIKQGGHYPLPDQSVDIIYSAAVLEHVHDLEMVFSEMGRVLKKNGYMYHIVDLRDHIFSQKSLFFLTIGDFWFRTFFKNTGEYVNRERVSTYQTLGKKYGFRLINLEITERYTSSIPKKLQQKYTTEDQETLGIIAIYEKI